MLKKSKKESTAPPKPKQKSWLKADGTPKRGYTKSGKSRVTTIKDRIDRKYMGPVVRSESVCFAAGYLGWQCSQRFECCHIVRRGEPVIFCDPLNVVCMCNVHHRRFTSHEHDWKEFVESRLPGRYDYLLRLQVAHKESKQKVDWNDWENWWKSKHRAVFG